MAQYRVDDFITDLNESLGTLGFEGIFELGKWYDPIFGVELTVAENIVLLANGGITNSFLSVLGAQEPIRDVETLSSVTLDNSKSTADPGFKALKALVAIGCGDVDELLAYGKGLAYVLKERG